MVYQKGGVRTMVDYFGVSKLKEDQKNENEKKRHFILKTFEIRDFIFRIEKFTQLKWRFFSFSFLEVPPLYLYLYILFNFQ